MLSIISDLAGLWRFGEYSEVKVSKKEDKVRMDSFREAVGLCSKVL